MLSEKQIEAADKATGGKIPLIELLKALTAAEQAEPAPAQCKHPVWGQDKDGTRVCAKCGLVEHPAARSGAVKVKAVLELVQYHVTDDDDRASLTTAISALEPAEPATDAEPVAWLYDWVDDDGETQTEASTNRISSVNFKPTSNVRPLYARPPESRLREALEHIARGLSLTFTSSPTKMSGNEAQEIARAALAQEDGR